MMQQKEMQIEPVGNPTDEGLIYQRGRSRSSFGNGAVVPKLGRKEEDCKRWHSRRDHSLLIGTLV